MVMPAMPQRLSGNGLRPYLESAGGRTDGDVPSSAAAAGNIIENTKTTTKTRRLALLGCETNEPYGPIRHTGELFLTLLEQAAAVASANKNDDGQFSRTTDFRIDLYNAKEEEYPNDWTSYDGVIIPGSFSAAYDVDPWIVRLQSVIQNEIVARQIPTLGICFGHQVIAHSYKGAGGENGGADGGGLATPTPSGARGGRFVMPLTRPSWLVDHIDNVDDDDKIADDPHLYFTHGDMVARLPATAVCLASDATVPVQAAAYFGSVKDKEAWLDENVKKQNGNTTAAKQPFAVTFQAHPEYATSMDRGVERTLCQCLQAQADRGAIVNGEAAAKDAIAAYDKVKSDSVKLMAKVLTMLGWD
jgi:GMP synthase-like glutamine amidotransferase